MRIKRKWGWGIGILAIIGAAGWMRELASWLPVVVGKATIFIFQPSHLSVSRDGKELLVEDDTRTARTILNLESGTTDDDLSRIRAFDGGEKYPRLSFDERAERVIFETAPQKKVVLHGLGIGRDIVGIRNGKSSLYGWSKSAREVYAAYMGQIYTWNWDDGQLKRRVRYAKNDFSRSVFSPDGKWLFTVEDSYFKQGSAPMDYLRLYNVQTGELEIPQLPEIDKLQANSVKDFGFSPDSKFIWYSGGGGPTVFRIANCEVMFSGDATGPVKWLPDGKIGLVTEDGFEFSGVKGELIQRLPGPFNSWRSPMEVTTDWALSPDGKWIYSVEQSGVIRRWRAR